jgi:hypothetical protein
MEEGARGLGVRVSYRDAEGDLVGIQGDDALRYAVRGLAQEARRQKANRHLDITKNQNRKLVQRKEM